MSTVLPFGSNAITTYLYEAFSYTISNPAPGTYTLATIITPGIPPGYLTNNGSNVVFASSSNGMGIGTEVFTITAKDASGTTISTSSNTVGISAGRFTDPSGNGYTGRNYTFYKNEPVTPIRLVAPFAVSTPTAVPALPPGLGYSNVSSTTYDITGTPLVTVPQSNYLFIGKATGTNLGKIVTTQFQLSVSNERVVLNLSGTPIVSPMTVGTPIAPRVLTARFPPYPSGGTLRWSWPGLPDGLVVTDLSGTVYPPTVFTPSDASATLIVSGTPSITAANNFRDANISSTTVPFTATRTNPLPQISNSQSITFGFGETVLFDTPSIPTFYSGVALDPSATFFRAQTYFGSGSAISNLFSPNLRSDLSINFVPGTGRGYLTGTPNTSTGTGTYTIRAINSNAVSRDLSASITVAADSVSFVSPPTPAVDVCYNFVLSRPISLSLSGYYTTPIQFQASAASGKPITFSAPALAGTGLSLSNVTANVVQLVGTPDTVTPLTTVTVTASAVGTPATASRTFKLAVLNDVITISDVSGLSFVQNRAITPIQFSATTLSTRPVLSFTSANLPTGLSLSTTGLLTGTPANDTLSPQTFTVTASTGYTSQNKVYTYNTVADNVLVVIPTTTVTVDPVFSNVQFDVLTYSGIDGNITSYFGPQGVQPKQSTTATLSVTAPSLLSGNFSGPPVLAPEYRFYVEGQAGGFTGLKQVNAIVNNPSTIQHTILQAEDIVLPNTGTTLPPLPSVSGGIYTSTGSVTSFAAPYSTIAIGEGPQTWLSRYTFANIEGNSFDMARNSNVYIAVLGSNVIRSTDYGNTWSQVPTSNIQTVPGLSGPQWSGLPDPLAPGPPRARFDNPLFGAIVSDGTSNWWALGFGTFNAPPPANPGSWGVAAVWRKSSDNGVTWMDISASPWTVTGLGSYQGPLNPWTQSNKLHYNQGRIFYTGIQYDNPKVKIPFFYVDTSNLLSWTKPISFLGINDQATYITGLAFSNTTAFAAGYDGSGTATYVSTDNGTTWTNGTNPIPGTSGFGGAYNYADIYQRYGVWFAAGLSNGFGYLASSPDLTTWQSRLVGGPFATTYTGTTENGITWVSMGNGSTFQSSLWQGIGSALVTGNSFTPSGLSGDAGNPSLGLNFQRKRLYSDVTVSPSNQTLTLSIPYDASGIVFTSPTQTQYTNWQFVPIPTIPIVATNPVPGSFLYYYASGLPRGLQLNLDASGIEASITGTSSQFSDAFQRVVLYAALNPGGGGGGVAAMSLTMRTLLPTVQKQQTSAGAWTSLLRQYTVVNAAQNSVNGRALPATEPPLGEFTRPEPPDSVSAPGDPNCVKKC